MNQNCHFQSVTHHISETIKSPDVFYVFKLDFSRKYPFTAINVSGTRNNLILICGTSV